MRRSFLSFLLIGLTVLRGAAFADAPLKTVLELDIDQAREVAEIQGSYRREYSAKRGEHNREERKLRRARIANDSEQIAIQEEITAKLEAELRAIKAEEDAAIRKVLNAEQHGKFDAYVAKRDAMVGSSRDIR